MPKYRIPKPHIPSPLLGSEEHTWANFTVTVRLPEIGRRVLVENAYHPSVAEKLDSLLQEIPYRPIRGIEDASAPDINSWHLYCAPHLGYNWLDVSWFFAETYFYRRILEATGYFQSGPYAHADPYTYQKQQGLVTTLGDIKILSSLLNEMLQKNDTQYRKAIRDGFIRMLHLCLWGNSLDLSLWPVKSTSSDHRTNLCGEDGKKEYILVEDTDALLDHILRHERPLERVDLILDNAGFELVCDLALVDFLLGNGLAAQVYLHPKSHPTFVSDAIREDVDNAISFLESNPSAEVQVFGNRLRGYLKKPCIHLREDFFWTSPLLGWEMPEDLYQELAHSDLIISKGDANYRRWLGDRHWPFTTPFADIMAYIPAPFLALRTLKAQVASGLKPEQIIELDAKDPDWMTNGRWGIIQFSA